MKYRTHKEIHAEMMRDDKYRAAYEAEERKERLQALLLEWRKHAGLTSAQVAERMGVKPPTVSRMEKNITSASVDTVARYAKACGVESAMLYF
ncbi:helix-turn-helix transcriptional regulator [Pantoea sp. Bo_2]|uniref:Helix-turn-helix transcriptional regulator n=1 Tax=Candidatus Pantoea gossypiicola TaxID=2608008 RepID=A0AB34CE35_9GAMM|nr:MULTISPECIES: helix-turn-helix transcriptional regulator [Pantoea]KAA5937569.1 helix-turn-helix transcriptional regulator [Pantoea sp. VH_3]KAA5946700.1 helix-turn-helix transcriptional regulator [Pantoea sp. VH_25]KAA5949520.1 helix-turn-helix transcriptional regulator [Pantoea sp. VH_24]KAA5957733.1 helix-turn-helix transcriptional regulator [Pantoea sp. VH_16]KAA5959134.1 helix-turn-helix transcriptional regulator [Pantoea sp. VH_18]